MPLNTPVAFFIFNRPETTQRVFAEIARIQPAVLLVIADGPRHAGEAEKCAQARAVAEQVNWPCTLLTHYSDRNLGCKERVASGLSWVFTQVSEAIILEDDCVPEPSFFPFCEQMLRRYREDTRVAMIAGTNYLLDKLAIPESYTFSRYFAIWGWATWKRAWQQYDLEMVAWETLKSQRQMQGFYRQTFMRNHLAASFDLAQQGRVDTWDIQWFYSCLFSSGLCIVPKVNLISNIGVVGRHSSAQDRNHFKPVFALDTAALIHPAQVFADQRYDAPFFEQQFQPPPPPPLLSRAGTAALRRMGSLLRSFKNHLLKDRLLKNGH